METGRRGMGLMAARETTGDIQGIHVNDLARASLFLRLVDCSWMELESFEFCTIVVCLPLRVSVCVCVCVNASILSNPFVCSAQIVSSIRNIPYIPFYL